MARRRILLTGADTLIGGRTLNQLLAYDVSVRAVVSSQDQGQVHLLRQQYPATRYPWLEIAIVPQSKLCTPGAFDDALRDHPEPFDTIIHVATDQPEGADCLARFVNLQTECLTNLLRSINRISTKVHRVVIMTSLSPFARWLVQPGSGPYNPYNPASHRSAEVDPEYILATSQASDNIVYAAIKNWMRGARARFELVYVTAPSVYGPSMQHLGNSSDLQEANRRIWNICSSDTHERVRSPPYGVDYYVDVRVSLISFSKGSSRISSAYTLLGFRDCRRSRSFCSTSWQ
jgi:nucleoside-diphosphate-sugar epimerase